MSNMCEEITIQDSMYPEKLLALPDAPKVLHVLGHLPEGKSIAIIGARMASEYGRYMARQFGAELAQAGYSLISGLSLGIDCTSTKAALRAGGKVYAVMGCGADVCYPPETGDLYDEIKAHFGVISACPDGMKPESRVFPERNRLIAALADAVIIVEAREKSSTIGTALFAASLGKPVFAVPGRVTDRLSDGTNRLIRDGNAAMAFNAKDVIQRMEENPDA